MKADLHLNNARVYDVRRFDVLVGQEFSIHLDGEAVGNARWFADQDAVLDITVKDAGGSATVKATALGACEIQIQDPDGGLIMRLNCEVFSKEAQGFTVPPPVVAPN